LKHNLWREGASIVIVGFQAKGTTGRKIVERAKRVRIFRENVAVRAKVFTIGGFSAHADQDDLLEWISNFESKPRVFVVHGELTASEALAKKIQERFNLEAHVPRWKQRLVLKPREAAYEEPPGEEAAPDMQTMVLNNIVDLENELKMLKKRVKSREMGDRIDEDEIDRLKYLQEELQAILSNG
jgi:metallo-beta-lactamase family protein